MRISKFSTVPRLEKVPHKQNLTANEPPNKSIVGSVTTWFPPSTKIQLNSTTSPSKNPVDPVKAPLPQSITIMGERKFLIVPKHTILSVSPTIGAAVNTPSAKPVSSPTADKAPLTVSEDKNIISADAPGAVSPSSASLGAVVPSDDPEKPVIETEISILDPDQSPSEAERNTTNDEKVEGIRPAQSDTE